MDVGSNFDLFSDSAATMLGVVIFLAVSIVAFAVMAAARARAAVRRRATALGPDQGAGEGRQAPYYAKLTRALVDHTIKHYESLDARDTKVLRRKLIQAGIYNEHAVAYFFIARTGLAGGLALILFSVLPLLNIQGNSSFWLFVIAGGLCGYLAPTIYLDRRVAARRAEHQLGFPDFMDLLVVCADAGLAVEAALDRIRRELGNAHPSLAANVHIANLEIRAGRTLAEALEHFAERIGIEEANSFAKLVQQSDELGASISKALRVYSDDMRHKRMSRAEEKAYSLPAKLAVPMMVCIFPVLFIVILTPVIVRLATGNW